ncbi:MAG: putative quinol monooxygenase [Sneathiella sp.]
MFAVLVDFTIKVGFEAQFRAAIMEQARNSLQKETGCHYFDVCVHPEKVTEFFLYELYDDKSAFDTHLASDHFLSFDAQVSPWVATKSVRILSGLAK